MKLTIHQIESLLTVNGVSHDKKYVHANCPVCGKPEFWLLFLENNQPCGCSRGSKCGWRGNIYTLLKLLDRSREFIGEYEVDVREKLTSTLVDEVEVEEVVLQEITPPVLWRRVYENEYLRSRGFTDEQFKKHEVGTSRLNKNYVTFLVRQCGVLTGYISRSIMSKAWIDEQKELGNDHLRYDNSGSDFSKMLYGLDEIIPGKTHTVILVEGIFSKTKTDENLLLDHLDEIKCVATFGSKLSDYQMKILRDRGVENLIFWFEADVLNKVKPILAKAALQFNVEASFLDSKDPGDIGPDEAMELFDSRRNYLDFNMSYVKSSIHGD